jgi:hypothetical protein
MTDTDIKLLKTRREIMVVLRINNNAAFKRYIKDGLPTRKEGGCWKAQRENVENWMKGYFK